MKKINKTRPAQNNLWIGISAIIFIVMLVLLINSNPTQSNFQPEDDVNSPTRGKVDAQVVIREFSDFACPACSAAYELIDQEIYPKYKDQVKFIHKDFPIHGEQASSYIAAIAGRCAQKQNKFWEYYQVLFTQQIDWETITDSQALNQKFINYAKSLSFSDLNSFGTCLVNKETEELIKQDQNLGKTRNINATPTFWVNNIRVVGIRELEDIIKKELAKLQT